METQGGLLSIINYAQLLGDIQLPTLPWGGSGYGGMTGYNASGLTTANVTITNNNDYGGVLLTQDELNQLDYYRNREINASVMNALRGYMGV